MLCVHQVCTIQVAHIGLSPVSQSARLAAHQSPLKLEGHVAPGKGRLPLDGAPSCPELKKEMTKEDQK